MGTQEGSPETNKQIQKGAGNDRVRCGIGSRFGTRVGVRRSGRKSRKGEPKAESIRQAGVSITRRSLYMEVAGTLETRRHKEETGKRDTGTHTD